MPLPGLVVQAVGKWCRVVVSVHVGGCQNCGPFFGTLHIGCRIIIRTQKSTIILTTTHVIYGLGLGLWNLTSSMPSGTLLPFLLRAGLKTTSCNGSPSDALNT